MQTVVKKYDVYSFDELSESAKEKVIESFRDDSFYGDWIFDEAGESLKSFCNIFSVNYRNIDFLEPYRNDYEIEVEDNIKELSGLRLRTYIINNYYSYLFKRKYLKSGILLDVAPKNSHRMRKIEQIKAKCSNQDKFSVSYYSNIDFDNCCPLTGVCYDYSVLEPIYKFLASPNKNLTFKDLVEDCISNLCNEIEGEYRQIFKEEYISEHCSANEYQFKEDGTLF